jgi:hypothetical protein
MIIIGAVGFFTGLSAIFIRPSIIVIFGSLSIGLLGIGSAYYMYKFDRLVTERFGVRRESFLDPWREAPKSQRMWFLLSILIALVFLFLLVRLDLSHIPEQYLLLFTLFFVFLAIVVLAYDYYRTSKMSDQQLVDYLNRRRGISKTLEEWQVVFSGPSSFWFIRRHHVMVPALLVSAFLVGVSSYLSNRDIFFSSTWSIFGIMFAIAYELICLKEKLFRTRISREKEW